VAFESSEIRDERARERKKKNTERDLGAATSLLSLTQKEVRNTLEEKGKSCLCKLGEISSVCDPD
jgi:hypothetical protein